MAGEKREGGKDKDIMSNLPYLIGATVGIIGTMMIYGVLQERIMTTPYVSDDGTTEMFSNSVFLVLNNRMCAFIAAALAVMINRESLANVAPIYKYFAISLSNVFATTCQYEALKYVNFPTQTLGKCAKMIPVMIWGSLIGSKKYSVVEYIVAVVVTIGATLFLLGGDLSKGSAHADKSTSVYGLVLMVGYLGFDGFTSTFQSMLFSNYKMSTYNQMMYVNLCSAILSLCALLSSGQFFPSLSFSMRHPSLWYDSTILSASAVIGQFIITATIKDFGALVFATIMTTRQFLSILFSCFWFLHPLTMQQWFGTILVFGALYYSTFAAPAKSHGHSHSEAGKADHSHAAVKA